MTNLPEKFCWYEPEQENTAASPEEKYQRIVSWASQARGTNPNVFDEVTTWLLGAGEWSEQELSENEQIFKKGILGRFLAQANLLREELNALLPSGIVNQAVFGALDKLEAELSGKTSADWLSDAVTAVFQNFSSIRKPEIRERLAGGLTGSAGTNTVKTFGYLNILKDVDASVQWTLFMPDVTRRQQDGFRMGSFEYRKMPAMRFIGKEGHFPKGSAQLTKLLATLDSMSQYRCGFDYDCVFVHHLGRGVDVEDCHCLWGRFMAADAPVPAGYQAVDFVPENNWESGIPYLSQFAFAKFTGNLDSMHEQKGFDCDAMYDVTRNTILGQNVIIPYPDKYWTAEVYLDGFEQESTAYLFSVDRS